MTVAVWLLVHEYGHLTGREHAADPADVMHATISRPVAECATTPPPAAAPRKSRGRAWRKRAATERVRLRR